jgi:hypothetical protein
MTEPEHKCEDCRRGYLGDDGVTMLCETGPDAYDECPDSRTCADWSERNG